MKKFTQLYYHPFKFRLLLSDVYLRDGLQKRRQIIRVALEQDVCGWLVQFS